jgi:hypothetical protein
MDSTDLVTDGFRARIKNRALRLRIIRLIELACVATILWHLSQIFVHY